MKFVILNSSFRIQNLKIAGVAQLVERQPSKLNVAGSNPVSRSKSSLISKNTGFIAVFLLKNSGGLGVYARYNRSKSGFLSNMVSKFSFLVGFNLKLLNLKLQTVKADVAQG